MRMSNNGSAKSRAGVYRDLDRGASKVRGVPAEEATVSEGKTQTGQAGVYGSERSLKKGEALLNRFFLLIFELKMQATYLLFASFLLEVFLGHAQV